MPINLPENVYPTTNPPTRDSGNAKGQILWYAKGHGWYVASWSCPFMPDTVYWTFMPEDLGIAGPDPVLKAFEAWAKACDLAPARRDVAWVSFKEGWTRGKS
jgi:hypothetical protein